MPQSFATLSELSAEYLLTNQGRLGFVILRLARDPAVLSAVKAKLSG